MHLRTHPLTHTIYNVCSIGDERAWDLFYDIIILDPVTTCHFSQLQLMWPYRRSRSSPFRDKWGAFSLYMWQIFDKSRDKMNNRRWDNPRAFGDEVDLFNPQSTSLVRVRRTSERFSWYVSSDLRSEMSSQVVSSTNQATVWLLNH
jgi:hypothetical protein